MIFYYLIAFIVIVVDQVTKYVVVRTMALSETIPLIEGVFHITSHRNTGAAFGILQDGRWFFIAITPIVLAAIVWYMPRIRDQRGALFAFSLILGGAVGNFIDRLLQGEVVDFFDFRLINFPIFNVADSCIVIGVILLLLDTLREARREKATAGLKVEDER